MDRAEDLLLPNLQTREPAELYLSVDPSDGSRELRFSTSVLNVGSGPMHLVGEIGEYSQTATATQLLKTADGGTLGYAVGSFSMDPAHSHWHLENFAVFELWSYTAAGGDLLELQASSAKITFCLLDEVRIDPPTREAAAAPGFVECDWREQGISPGWMETYVASLPGQAIDITDLPAGRYALRTVLDPEGQLREADGSDNVNVAYVQIEAEEATLLASP